MKNHPFLNPNPVVFAHRGNSFDYPENTFLAFDSAVKLGVDVIETDVHLSKDKQVIIWHDDSFLRMTGIDKKVSQLNWNEIKKIDAGCVFSKNNENSFPFKNQGIRPILLHEALIKYPLIRFNIDLKTKSKQLVMCYINVLNETNSINRVLTASFFNSNLKLIRKKLPQALTCLGRSDLRKLIILNKFGLSFLKNKYSSKILQVPLKSGLFKIITKKFLQQVHNQGFLVQVWTINDKKKMEYLLELGIDGIFTDRPDILLSVINSLKS